jgi:hypothetical protein
VVTSLDADHINATVAPSSPLCCPEATYGNSDLDKRLSATQWNHARGGWPGWDPGAAGNFYAISGYGINTNSVESVEITYQRQEYTARTAFPGSLPDSRRMYFLEVNWNTREPCGKVAGGSLMASEYNFWKVNYQHRYRRNTHGGEVNYMCADGHLGTLVEDLFMGIGASGPTLYYQAISSGALEARF